MTTLEQNTSINPQIEESWKEALKNEFKQDYFTNLKTFLVDEKKKHVIYPPGAMIFNAFNYTPFNDVKVVLLGQDPYHGPGQAHGLCFSVANGVQKPPSLINIFKEIQSDLKQGVLLLNATLTVRAHQAGSHQKKGWETFTDAAITAISKNKTGVVFLLWGAYAQAKVSIIDQSKHFVLTAPHPSPLSVTRGFFGFKN
jgi:uracil-DNA glycosylase